MSEYKNGDEGYSICASQYKRSVLGLEITWMINGFEVPAPIPKKVDGGSFGGGVFVLDYRSSCGFEVVNYEPAKKNAIMNQLAFRTALDVRKNVAALRGTYNEEFGK